MSNRSSKGARRDKANSRRRRAGRGHRVPPSHLGPLASLGQSWKTNPICPGLTEGRPPSEPGIQNEPTSSAGRLGTSDCAKNPIWLFPRPRGRNVQRTHFRRPIFHHSNIPLFQHSNRCQSCETNPPRLRIADWEHTEGGRLCERSQFRPGAGRWIGNPRHRGPVAPTGGGQPQGYNQRQSKYSDTGPNWED
jgi:hypothetical protein